VDRPIRELTLTYILPGSCQNVQKAHGPPIRGPSRLPSLAVCDLGASAELSKGRREKPAGKPAAKRIDKRSPGAWQWHL